MWNAFLYLIYPSDCIACQARLALDEKFLCGRCTAGLPRLCAPVCCACAMELPRFENKSSLCPNCRHAKHYFTRGSALLRYENSVKTVIQRVKFGKRSWYLKLFRAYSAEIRTPLALERYDWVVPVPLDSKRNQEREFNQSEIIARLFFNRKGRPSIRLLLKKVKSTAPQSKLHHADRLHNVRDAFRLKRGVSVRGKTILLVDDVMTTGSTLNECAKCLKTNGALRVDFFSLARTMG